MSRIIITAVAVLVGLALVILAIPALSPAFTVHQAQQAMVLQFGNPIRVVQAPGLHFKLPFLQNVVYFDKRLLDFDAEPQEVILQDQKRLVVDAFARYRIVDPLKFYQTVRTENAMRQILGSIVSSSIRNLLGSAPFSAVLSGRRAELMRQISQNVIEEAKSFGVDIVDVRMMRADLHPDNSPAIFARMQTEREREAKQERAEGSETAQRIRAEAERDRTVLLADAHRQANILRGQGDAEATKVFAEGFGRDPQFYAFYRSLQAYQRALGDGNSTMVLTPDSEFFRFFRDLSGVDPRPAGAPRK